jgi:uncharacterized protein YjbI with pentapeptide repeats
MQPQKAQDFSGKKFNRKDFTNQDLKFANFRNASVIECDFSGADLTYANFTGCNCYGSNFTNAIMSRTNLMDANLQRSIMKPKDAFGMTLTMKCESFTDMEIDDTWLKVWLFLPAQMKLPELSEKQISNGEKTWLDKIIILLGEKTYVKFRSIFANRIV